jgi:hypothetical protein
MTRHIGKDGITKENQRVFRVARAIAAVRRYAESSLEHDGAALAFS